MAGVSFDPNAYDKLIEEQGYNAIWYQAIVCECVIDGAPQISCPYCKGEGFRYIRKSFIKVLSTSFSGKMDINLPGLTQPGSVYVTPQRDVIMGYHDMLVFYEINCKYSQHIKMGENQTSSTFRSIKEVVFVMAGDYVYEEGIDFKISDDNHHLIWLDEETKPEKGTAISILYYTSPKYLINDLTHELRSVRVNKGVVDAVTEEMNKQYLAKRIDFVYGQNVNVEKKDTVGDTVGFSYD